jgi:hypothetical protein
VHFALLAEAGVAVFGDELLQQRRRRTLRRRQAVFGNAQSGLALKTVQMGFAEEAEEFVGRAPFELCELKGLIGPARLAEEGVRVDRASDGMEDAAVGRAEIASHVAFLLLAAVDLEVATFWNADTKWRLRYSPTSAPARAFTRSASALFQVKPASSKLPETCNRNVSLPSAAASPWPSFERSHRRLAYSTLASKRLFVQRFPPRRSVGTLCVRKGRASY